MKQGPEVPMAHVVVPRTLAPAFAGLLRQGIGVWLPAPKPVRDFLVEEVGLELGYATHEIPGLFLNGVAVDDWENTLVAPGDEVALSGTMPGLAGIALRRQSPLRSFRSDLTVPFRSAAAVAGMVTLRPFNFVAQQAVQPLLARGVYVSGAELARYVEARADELGACRLMGGEGCLEDAMACWRQVEVVHLQVVWEE